METAFVINLCFMLNKRSNLYNQQADQQILFYTSTSVNMWLLFKSLNVLRQALNDSSTHLNKGMSCV